MIIRFKSNKIEWYKQFIKIISITIHGGLSSTEIDILDQIYKLGDTDEKLITPNVRRLICSNLNISSQNLNNYITKLKSKSLIVYNRLNPKLNKIDITDKNVYELKILLTE